jgi:glycosyltransferase involved in cell wall biosynthesis
MKISIVTPVFNDLRISGALDSILGQEMDAELELIVIDGGSTDGTLDVIEKYRDRIAIMVSEPDGGIRDAQQKGVLRATGDVVGILNADDKYQGTDVLQGVVEAFDDPDIGVVFGDLVFVDEQDQVVRRWTTRTPSRLQWHLGWMAPHPTFFVRRGVYDDYGVFVDNLDVAYDYEFMLRVMLKHRVKSRYLKRVMVRMAAGGYSSQYKNVVKGNIESYRAWRMNKLTGGILVPLVKPGRKIIQNAPQWGQAFKVFRRKPSASD